ncbi:bacterio-opsin activator [Natronococcus pandeyae]|uniref:Bacterio-opsin activator n=1 Tax=Natronococcus pandeyae TaxID=2055836 RepID=A0A8J8TSA9_9EURY|nr:helix-turn-helix domain-containing protein [Natronococcus pandeyae]TYL38332.1 bacterio-opsin activator [Natronococcus pandeyae]
MLIAEFRIDSPLFRTALERAPEVTLSIEEHYAAPEGIRVLFWAAGDGVSDGEFQSALEADPTVTESTQIAETPSRTMYRVTVSDEGEAGTTYREWSALDIVSVDITATNEGWTGRLRFPDREALAKYRAALRDRGLEFHLRSLYQETGGANGATASLTSNQHEALVTAYESGYFDVPRGASQPDVAAQLDIASQSVSERLRRGTKTLVERTLIDE